MQRKRCLSFDAASAGARSRIPRDADARPPLSSRVSRRVSFRRRDTASRYDGGSDYGCAPADRRRRDRTRERLTMDVLTTEQRRHKMSRIRSKDTKPEMQLRRGLHAAGLRFRLHAAALPGKPDMVFPRHRSVILMHGCFWHGHDCPLFKVPATRPEFWRKKISGNRESGPSHGPGTQRCRMATADGLGM